MTRSSDRGAATRAKESWIVSQEHASRCSLCGALAVVALPDWLVARQPDDTTHVCHPGFGGCNHGFAAEVRSCPKRVSGPCGSVDMYVYPSRTCSRPGGHSGPHEDGPCRWPRESVSL